MEQIEVKFRAHNTLRFFCQFDAKKCFFVKKLHIYLSLVQQKIIDMQEHLIWSVYLSSSGLSLIFESVLILIEITQIELVGFLFILWLPRELGEIKTIS